MCYHGDIANSTIYFAISILYLVRFEIQRIKKSGFELCLVPLIELLELCVCCAKSNMNLHANFVLHLMTPHGLYTLGLIAHIQLYHVYNQHVTRWVGFFHPLILWHYSQIIYIGIHLQNLLLSFVTHWSRFNIPFG